MKTPKEIIKMIRLERNKKYNIFVDSSATKEELLDMAIHLIDKARFK